GRRRTRRRHARRFGTRGMAYEWEKMLTALVLKAEVETRVSNLRIEHVESSHCEPGRCRPVHFDPCVCRLFPAGGIAQAAAPRTRRDAAARSSAQDRLGSLSGVADECRWRAAAHTE